MASTRPARAHATTIGTNNDCSISAAQDSALANILSSLIGEISLMPYWILTSVRDKLNRLLISSSYRLTWNLTSKFGYYHQSKLCWNQLCKSKNCQHVLACLLVYQLCINQYLKLNIRKTMLVLRHVTLCNLNRLNVPNGCVTISISNCSVIESKPNFNVPKSIIKRMVAKTQNLTLIEWLAVHNYFQ